MSIEEQVEKLMTKCVELQAENEHLIGVVESTRQDYDDLLDGTKETKLQAENERLKKAILDFGNGEMDFDWAVLDRIDVLEAENAKLKEALTTLQKFYSVKKDHDAMWLIREALKG